MTTAADTQLDAYLAALLGPHPDYELLEIRYRRATEGMAHCFHAADDLDTAARIIAELGAHTDVYVGAAPRSQRCGSRRAVQHSWVVWADCDDRNSTERLMRFEPAASIVVRSGSAHARHAYWLLDTPLPPDALEFANRRLAVALAADLRSTDAARILRPPGTHNFKHRPAVPVVVEHLALQRLDPHAVLAHTPRLDAPAGAQRTPAKTTGTDEPLRRIAPDTYVRALLGVDVPRSRKIRCPFHDDHTPSLHVYETAEGGWYCFGCGAGSSIYDMAAAVYGLGTRGADFVELRRRLTTLMLPPRPVSRLRGSWTP